MEIGLIFISFYVNITDNINFIKVCKSIIIHNNRSLTKGSVVMLAQFDYFYQCVCGLSGSACSDDMILCPRCKKEYLFPRQLKQGGPIEREPKKIF